MNAFNVLVNAISCVDLEPDKAVIVLEHLIKYRDVQVSDFNRVAFALEDAGERIDELSAENEELTKKVGELERALAAVTPAPKLTITMNLVRMFDAVDKMSEKFISYVKWVRSDGAVLSDGGLIGLYEARFISDYVFAYFDYKPMSSFPSRGENYEAITWDSDRDELKQNIEWLLEYNYPGYEVVWE